MFTNKQLKELIVPLMIEQILVMSVGMIDTVMTSYLGEVAISGVALVDMLDYLVITILTAIATGGAVIISQYLGSKNKDMANMSASQLIVVLFIISIFIMLISLLFRNEILMTLFGNISDDVREAANTYFFITAISFPFIGVYNAGSALFRSIQKTNTTMWISLLINFINICGNAIAVFVLKIGVFGIAFSTLIARLVSSVIIFILALRKDLEVNIEFKKIISIQKNIIKKILKIAIPNGIENGLFALGKVMVVSIVSLFGTSQIAANGVANSIDQLAVFVASAINIAMITVVGQCIGAREIEQAEYYTKKLMKISYILTSLLGVTICILLPVILKLYTLSNETYKIVCILVISHNIMAALLHPTSFNLSNSLRACGDVKFTMYTGIASMIIFRLGTAVLLGIYFKLGIYGVWIAMGMDWLARSILFKIRYKSKKWQYIQTI